MNMVHCNLDLQGSSDPPASASRVAGATCMHHYAWLIYTVFVETESPYVSQAGLKLLGSSAAPALVSQTAGILGGGHHTQPIILNKCLLNIDAKTNKQIEN